MQTSQLEGQLGDTNNPATETRGWSVFFRDWQRTAEPSKKNADLYPVYTWLVISAEMCVPAK